MAFRYTFEASRYTFGDVRYAFSAARQEFLLRTMAVVLEIDGGCP